MSLPFRGAPLPGLPPAADLVGLMNQAVMAGGNLLVSVYLMRALTTAEFGFYAVSLSAILLSAGAANALILSQMVVNAPDKVGRERAIYAADMHFLIWCLAFPPLALILAAVAAGVGGAAFAGFLVPTSAAAFAYLVREFFTRFFFSEAKPGMALAVNTANFASVAALLLWWGAQQQLDLVAALWIIAASHAIAALVGAFASRLPLLNVSWRRSWRSFSQSRANSAWALIGVMVTWVQSQAYIYALLLVIGAQAAGIAAGARILVSPLNNLVVGLAQTAVPKMAAARAEGKPKVLAISGRYTRVLMWLSFLYGPALLLPLVLLFRHVVPPAYVSEWTVIVAWWMASLAQAYRFGTSNAMIALKRFRSLTVAGAAAAVVTVAAAVGLGLLVGIAGSIAAVAVGEMVLSALIRRDLRKA